MNKSLPKVKKHKMFITGGLVLLILIIVTWVGIAVFAPSKNERPEKDGRVTLNGELVCLPHKNTDGPHTLECAIGFKSGDDYYGLKDDAQKVGTLPFNKPAEVEGVFKVESGDMYNMRGSITVERVELK